MPSYAVRLSGSYGALAQVCVAWALKSEKMLVYQHDEATRPHIHVLIVNCCSSDNLKLIAKSLGLQYKGNKDWSFKTADEDNLERYIVYMTKGKYDPSYNLGFSPEELANFKASWVEAPAEAPSKDLTRYLEFQDEIYESMRKPNANYKSIDELLQFRIPPNDFHGWEFLSREAREFSFRKFSVWNIAAANCSKMLRMTFAMRHSVPIPAKAWN